MARKAKQLSALEVGRLKDPGMWAVGGVAGLYLHISLNGARSWILRATVGSKRRDMGLGGFPDVTLAGAYEKARQAREKIDSGNDPVLERKQAKSALLASQAAEVTFKKCATAYIDAHGDTWRNAKHRGQWTNSLETYAGPFIGNMLVADITHTHILQILEPIWKTKTETATRVRGRLESVLDWATVRGYRVGNNPARWKGHLDKLLPAPGKITKVIPREALPIDDMGAFMADLRKREALAARALEFGILTAARSGEVRGMTWAELDLNAAVWTVPAERMKAGKEHRVPLSETAIRILNGTSHQDGIDLVFPAPRGGLLSDMALTALLRRMNVPAVPHGFRSTFRDWTAERTNYPRDLAEAALAHQLESKVEAAYLRSDVLEKRRAMMQAWSDFCDLPSTPGSATAIDCKAAV